jgi:hypothetical protein
MGSLKRGFYLGFSCLSLLACEAHDVVLPWRSSFPADAADASSSSSSVTSPPSPAPGAQDAGSTLHDAESAPIEAAVAVPDAAPVASEASVEAATPPPVDAGPEAQIPAPPMPKDPDCDMNGIWAGRQTTRSEALLAGQFANNWYYLEYEQRGEDVVVTKHWNCGLEVQGSATVKVSRPTAEALLAHNSQVGRKGKMYKDTTGKCHFEMERWWSARGVTEARFVPTPRNATLSLAQVAAATPLPVPARPDGAEDWENDGKLGMAVQISGILSGVRNTVQRDYTEWSTDSVHPVVPALDFRQDLDVRVTFVGEEVLFDPLSGLLAQLAQPDGAARHRVTLHFLGRSASDPRAAALLKPVVFDTCQGVQALLPAKNNVD